MSDRIGGPHFGDPIKPEDITKRITAESASYDFGHPESAAEAAPYYYGRWSAMHCAFLIAGELMDRATKEVLYDRLLRCHALAKTQGLPRSGHVEEAGNYFLLLAEGVRQSL